MARDGFNFNENYCKECELRKAVGAAPSPDNKGVRCPGERKSNPISLKATVNVIKNGGEVCSMNPVRQHFGRVKLKAMAHY